MKNIGIRDIQFFLPEKILTNQEMIKELQVDPVFLEQKIGVLERRIAATDQAASDLAVAAAEKIFKNNGIHKRDIELLIVVTQNPDYKLPHTAALVQDQLVSPPLI